ncbi:venom acid phosphatase Acph-1-like [Athalia rosae]|uniref:venom acid phosphatase Acph-1-like n=1 Tax=Athalia rosae TaxID=37344 RepID=UPI002033DA91|nr:venom acid phosphatase Acph-1-like [Athalia rosae]
MRALKALILCCFISISGNTCAGELNLIQVIFRHGDRTPNGQLVSYYPADPYANETWYPDGWVSLTNVGKRRAYDLGVFLRERYGNWLGDVYLKDEVEFRSSTYDRTMMTAQLVAAGLFPPSEIQRWHPELNWQPIPVFSDPKSTADLYDTRNTCQRLEAMRDELTRTDPHLLQRAEESKEFYDFLTPHVGKTVGQLETWATYHQLLSQSHGNLKLPEWTTGIFPEGQMERIAAYQYVIESYNKSMIQLGGGRWVNDWLKNVDNYLNETSGSQQKALFYAAHETNIASILVALGVFEEHVPSYCSTIIFELSKVEEEYYVKVSYKDGDVLQELVIPGCEVSNCPLETFRQMVKDAIYTGDLEMACRLN